MEYKELIRKKNRAFIVSMFICIALRSVANAFFVPIGSMVAMVVAGLVLTVILDFLSRFISPIVMMYMMVLLMTTMCVMLNVAFPCTTNFLMFFLAIFLVVLYEDIKPIVLQCALSAIGMIWAYVNYQDRLAETWGLDALVISLTYIASAMIIYISLCRMTRAQFAQLQETSKKSEEESKKANALVDEISKSVGVLGTTSSKISETVDVTTQISGQIATATEDITRVTAAEVDDADEIRQMVAEGVSQIDIVSASSSQMEEVAGATEEVVENGGKQVSDLMREMDSLRERMTEVSQSVGELNEATGQIVSILATLDEITSQTNLLSLNASIEAARAGDAGRGFAVVATEIRTLSENSASFTSEIHEILDGVNAQTEKVKNEIANGMESLDVCVEHAGDVDRSFGEISEHTKEVYEEAVGIGNKSKTLAELLSKTLTNAQNISDNVSSTSAAMEEISASIQNLNGNIDNVVNGYKDIDSITTSLITVSGRDMEGEAIETDTEE
ncbi:MAG: hypothetical protein K5853_01060 [Lachnospiraceae bacterium]|nr:hypothetical protein [Lachnospiraceae bacterium]